MKNALKSFASNPATARVVDGKLILSLPHALTPVVWQMDLTQARSSALEVRENKTQGSFVLVLKTPRGDDTEIAPFAARTDAIEALMAVSRALEKAQGQIRPFASVGSSESGATMTGNLKTHSPRSMGKWIAMTLGIILLLVLLNIWGAFLPRQTGVRPLEPAQLDQVQPPADTGVPMSADEFLKTR